MKGEVGEVGLMGPKGNIGEMGDTGSKGGLGAKGDMGMIGPEGPTGEKGLIGLKVSQRIHPYISSNCICNSLCRDVKETWYRHVMSLYIMQYIYIVFIFKGR